jgi:hypothetical protein
MSGPVNIEQSRVHAGCHGSGDEMGFSEEGITALGESPLLGERMSIYRK